MATVESNESVTTRLLTLLNVSAVSTKKRKRAEETVVTLPPSKKLNAKKREALEEAQMNNKGLEAAKDTEMNSGDTLLEDSKEPEGTSLLFVHPTLTLGL